MGLKSKIIDEREMGELVHRCHKYLLDNRRILGKYTYTELCKICNGIGPESWPKWITKTISEVNPSAKLASLIHDVECYESEKKPGTKLEFRQSNIRFFINTCKAALGRYRWYDPRILLAALSGLRFKFMLDIFGKRAYKIRRTKTDER